jgi:hypothetical protein
MYTNLPIKPTLYHNITISHTPIGHALFLALGFPFETTVAVSRLIVSGTMDRYVSMYVCMYVCMYVSMYVCQYVSMYVCMSVCQYVSMYV